MNATLRRIVELSEVRRAHAFGVASLGALAAVLGAALMASAGYLISRAAERPPILALTVTIVLVRALGLARPIARYAERLAAHDLALRALGRFRSRAFGRLRPLPPAGERHRQGDLLARWVADVDSLQRVYLVTLLPPPAAFLAAAACVGAALYVLPLAGLVLAGGLLFAGAVLPVLAGMLGRRGGRRAEARGALTAELVELLTGGPELVACNREGDRLAALRASDAALVRMARRDALADGVGEALRLLVVGVTLAGVLAAAVAAHADGRLDRTAIALLALLALASFDPLQPLLQSARELPDTLAAGRRVLNLVDATPEQEEQRAALAVPPGPVTMALEGVSVRYAPEEPLALNDLSLVLEPGQRVALLGPSGSGKTTVANLLLRFLDPEEGRVTLDGRDVRDYRREDVRRVVALAGQDSHLFSASIRQNVVLARPEATDGEAFAALGRAGLARWVRALPDGLDTFVGEGGRALSGGQQQRLVTARALLADTPVLILDEPTAHLDPPTAERLMQDILGPRDDRSILLITHRTEGLDLVDDVHTLLTLPRRRWSSGST